MNRPQMIENLKQDVQRLIDEGYETPTVSNHGIAALITRIEELEATIQRVRDLAARLEGSDHPLGKFIAADIRQALEGDPQ